MSFGNRVPGTDSHVACGDFLVEKLKSFNIDVIEQTFETTAWNGEKLPGRNIVGVYNPQARKRILLAAHWDTRPYADQEADAEIQNTAIAGANDGASGVAVLLEMARVISQDSALQIGVDFMLFDGTKI